MIRVEDASFAYEHGQCLFKDLFFEVGAGETLAVLGANGIGKTTLFRCLMRFLKLDTGRIFLEDRDATRMKDAEFWRHISYVPQAKGIVFGYSALNMVVMGRSHDIGFGRLPKKEDYTLAMRILEELGLAGLSGRPCSKMSGGQLQMVLIARALAKDPKILIMDEPESGLDMKNQLKTLEIIEDLSHQKGYTVIINTHFPEHALRCADKTLLLGKDCYVFAKTSEVVTAENIERHFEVKARVLSFEANAREYKGIVPIGIMEADHAQ
jgi:iron complex transport system ATP-binding protein